MFSPQAPQRAPELLVRWQPFWPTFLENLRDTLLRRELAPLALTSHPAPFWGDVFVHRPMPWKNFGQSGVIHAGLLLLIVSTGHLWFTRQPTLQDQYTHTTITYYDLSQELPQVKMPAAKPARPMKGEPELAKQKITSVPAEADNSRQTIVNPMHPNVIRQEVPLPNLMVWTNIPAPPVAALKSQVTLPRMDVVPVAPAPDLSRLRSRSQLKMKSETVVEAQPSLESLKTKRSELALANASDVAAPAPRIELPLQRSAALAQGGAQDVVPPPPSLAALGSEPRRDGAGQLLALSVTPQPPAGEIKVPDGSRRGVFEASPSGRAGAPGTPNIPASSGASAAGAGHGDGKSPGGGSGTGNGLSPMAGISVTGGSGKPATGAVVATVPPRELPKTLASAQPLPLIDRRPIPVYPPPSERKLEDQVFNGRKSYSMQLNMANLTSAGGSWIIHFAELKESTEKGELSTPTVMNKVDPAYPPDLIKDQVEGIVTLYAVIHADGSVGEVRLLQGLHERLDESAMKALLRWHFHPAMKNGVPVDLEAVVSVPFKARRLSRY